MSTRNDGISNVSGTRDETSEEISCGNLGGIIGQQSGEMLYTAQNSTIGNSIVQAAQVIIIEGEQRVVSNKKSITKKISQGNRGLFDLLVDPNVSVV